jgi:hypothetical protein
MVLFLWDEDNMQEAADAGRELIPAKQTVAKKALENLTSSNGESESTDKVASTDELAEDITISE